MHAKRQLTVQYFLYKKERSKHVRVLAVCNTQKKFFLIYMYICHIASKTGYSKYKISIFTIQKKTHKKINTHALPAYCSSELNFT